MLLDSCCLNLFDPTKKIVWKPLSPRKECILCVPEGPPLRNPLSFLCASQSCTFASLFPAVSVVSFLHSFILLWGRMWFLTYFVSSLISRPMWLPLDHPIHRNFAFVAVLSVLFYFYFFVDGKDYIELVMKADNSSVPTPSRNPSKRPRVRCDQRVVAHKVGNNGCRKLGIVILCITVKFTLR